MKSDQQEITQDQIELLALRYLETERQFMQNRIAEIEGRINQLKKLQTPAGSVTAAPAAEFGSTPNSKPQRLGPEARQRIAEAQKKRWAKIRRAKRVTGSNATAKRRSRVAAAGQAASPVNDHPEEE